MDDDEEFDSENEKEARREGGKEIDDLEKGAENQDELFGVFYRNGRRTSQKDSDTDASNRDDGDNYDHVAFME